MEGFTGDWPNFRAKSPPTYEMHVRAKYSVKYPPMLSLEARARVCNIEPPILLTVLEIIMLQSCLLLSGKNITQSQFKFL